MNTKVINNIAVAVKFDCCRTCDDEATFSGNVDVQDFMRYVKNTPEIRTLRFQCEEKIYRQKDQTKYSGIGPNPAAESDVSTVNGCILGKIAFLVCFTT